MVNISAGDFIVHGHGKRFHKLLHKYTKPPESVDIIIRTSLDFSSWCPEGTHPTDSCFQGTSCENLMMYCGLYQQTRVVLYLLYTQPEISFNYCIIA